MIITNGKIITWEKPNRILEGYAIRITGQKIESIEKQKELLDSNPEDETLDAKGQYVMPGNICAHTHFYGTFSRGMSIPGSPARDFPEILQKLWWRLDKALTADGIQYSALVCMLDAIRHGTTTLIDHHASPHFIDGSLDLIAESAKKSGLRIATCYEVTDRDGPEKTKQGIAENLRFIRETRANRSHQLAACFGLHASLTLGDSTLDACRGALPEGSGFHIHAAEHPADQYDSLGKSGMRVINRLEQHGILSDRTILAHCVHIDAAETNILAQTGSWVTHQPRSNMNNAVGMAEIEVISTCRYKAWIG